MFGTDVNVWERNMYLRKDDSKLTYNLVITIKNKDFPLSLLLARILKTLKKKINELEYEYNEETYTLKVYKLPFKDIRKVLNNLRDFEEDLDIDLVPYGEQESYKEELSFSDELKIVAHSILKFEFLKEPIFWGLVIAIIPNYIYIFLGNNIESFFLVQNIPAPHPPCYLFRTLLYYLRLRLLINHLHLITHITPIRIIQKKCIFMNTRRLPENILTIKYN